MRTAAFLLRFLLPSIQSHGALPAAVISGVINLAAAAHYRRRILSPCHYRAVSFAVNTIARRITGGGYIRHYQFGGGGALPAAAFLSPPPIAVIYRRHLKHCAITGAIITAHGGVSFAVSFAVNINRTALPAAVISGIINLAAAAHYRRRILSPS